jgi:hypothetical protein
VEAACIALANVGVERCFALACATIVGRFGFAAKLRPRRRKHQLVQRALLAIERLVDAVHLFFSHDIGAVFLELRQALVIGFLEAFESAQEFSERLLDFALMRGVSGLERLGFQFHVFSFCKIKRASRLQRGGCALPHRSSRRWP